jgi:mRNA interferase HigB
MVNVVSKRGLAEIVKSARVDSQTAEELNLWCKVTRAAEWTTFADVRRAFPTADQVGAVIVFNIRHNRYRLITLAVLKKQKLYVKALLTHKEYDREDWKKWA